MMVLSLLPLQPYGTENETPIKSKERQNILISPERQLEYEAESHFNIRLLCLLGGSYKWPSAGCGREAGFFLRRVWNPCLFAWWPVGLRPPGLPGEPASPRLWATQTRSPSPSPLPFLLRLQLPEPPAPQSASGSGCRNENIQVSVPRGPVSGGCSRESWRNLTAALPPAEGLLP